MPPSVECTLDKHRLDFHHLWVLGLVDPANAKKARLC